MNYFTVEVIGEPQYSRTVFAPTRGKAKYSYLLDLWDAWGREAISFQHLRILPTGRAERPPIAKRYFERGRGFLRSDVIARIVDFLEKLPAFTREQWEYSYPLWAKDNDGWRIVGMGGTCITRALVWYHHTFQPGSAEHRAAVILAALIAATESEVAA